MLDFLESVDRALFLKINSHHSVFMDNVMWELSSSWHTYALVLLAAFIIHRKLLLRRAAEFVLGCAIVVACSDFSTNMVKHGVKRYRPTHNTEIGPGVHTVRDADGKPYMGGTYGFFSSHAANCFGLAAFALLFFYKIGGGKKWWFFFYPVLVAYSRVYLGVHYPADVAVGAVWGVFWAVVVFRVMNTYFFKPDA